MARPKKPTALKLILGTYRKDRDKAPDPTGNAACLLQPPRHLSRPEKDIFQKLALDLYEARITGKTDGLALELLATVWSDYLEASQIVDREGQILEIDGALKKHPAVSIRNEYWRMATCMLKAFGLTPHSRNNVAAIGGDPAPVDPWEKL